MNDMTYAQQVEKWDVWEFACVGPADGNPFTDQSISATFEGAQERVEVEGFYDGCGRFAVRFMPSFEGEYQFLVQSSFSSEAFRGSFLVLPASQDNHGPVLVANQCAFAYEDGTPYYSIGTTCYV